MAGKETSDLDMLRWLRDTRGAAYTSAPEVARGVGIGVVDAQRRLISLERHRYVERAREVFEEGPEWYISFDGVAAVDKNAATQ